jgi:hypothetical protein
MIAQLTEFELKSSFAQRVKAEPVVIPLHAVLDSIKGITNEIENERYPDRKKKLKQIKRQLEDLIL